MADEFADWFMSFYGGTDFEYSYSSIVEDFQNAVIGGMTLFEWVDAYFETRDEYGEWDRTRAPINKI